VISQVRIIRGEFENGNQIFDYKNSGKYVVEAFDKKDEEDPTYKTLQVMGVTGEEIDKLRTSLKLEAPKKVESEENLEVEKMTQELLQAIKEGNKTLVLRLANKIADRI
jgi:hypothetical protein